MRRIFFFSTIFSFVYGSVDVLTVSRFLENSLERLSIVLGRPKNDYKTGLLETGEIYTFPSVYEAVYDFFEVTLTQEFAKIEIEEDSQDFKYLYQSLPIRYFSLLSHALLECDYSKDITTEMLPGLYDYLNMLNESLAYVQLNIRNKTYSTTENFRKLESCPAFENIISNYLKRCDIEASQSVQPLRGERKFEDRILHIVRKLIKHCQSSTNTFSVEFEQSRNQLFLEWNNLLLYASSLIDQSRLVKSFGPSIEDICQQDHIAPALERVSRANAGRDPICSSFFSNEDWDVPNVAFGVSPFFSPLSILIYHLFDPNKTMHSVLLHLKKSQKIFQIRYSRFRYIYPLEQIVKICNLVEFENANHGFRILKDCIQRDIPYRYEKEDKVPDFISEQIKKASKSLPYGEKDKVPHFISEQIKKASKSLPWTDVQLLGTAMDYFERQQQKQYSILFSYQFTRVCKEAEKDIYKDLSEFSRQVKNLIEMEYAELDGKDIPDALTPNRLEHLGNFSKWYLMFSGFDMFCLHIEKMKDLFKNYQDFRKMPDSGDFSQEKKEFLSDRKLFFVFSIFLESGELSKLLKRKLPEYLPSQMLNFMNELLTFRDYINHHIQKYGIDYAEEVLNSIGEQELINIIDGFCKLMPVFERYSEFARSLSWSDLKTITSGSITLSEDEARNVDFLTNKLKELLIHVKERMEDVSKASTLADLLKSYNKEKDAKKKTRIFKRILEPCNLPFLKRKDSSMDTQIRGHEAATDGPARKHYEDLIVAAIENSIPHVPAISEKKSIIFHIENLSLILEKYSQSLSPLYQERPLSSNEMELARFYLTILSESAHYIKENLYSEIKSPCLIQNLYELFGYTHQQIDYLLMEERNPKAHLHILVESYENSSQEANINPKLFKGLIEALADVKKYIENNDHAHSISDKYRNLANDPKRHRTNIKRSWMRIQF